MSGTISGTGTTTFNYTGGGIFDEKVVTTSLYSIVVYGAGGGGSNAETISEAGGLSAQISGDFVLTAGTYLDIDVGGQGANSGSIVAVAVARGLFPRGVMPRPGPSAGTTLPGQQASSRSPLKPRN